jgi:lipoprotein-anchoring transpeptidase ErfK/SrfK
LVLRISISLVVIVAALAGTLGSAAAQYYGPPPTVYPPPPPYSGPGPYAASGPVYRDANGVPYAPGAVRPAPGEEADAAPPMGRPYFAPQPMASVAGESFPRPPAAVADAADPADVTGSLRSPTNVAPSNMPPSNSAPGNGAPGYGANPSAVQPDRGTVVASLPPEDQPEQGPAKELPPQFRRQIVDFATVEPAGTIVIDTPHTYLFLVLGNGKAIRYGIGVGRDGFTWSGTERISRMKEWPDWFPPKEMIERQPYLPRFMAGGDTNPLGARAMYLGSTLYRIHGTNQPSTIGTYVSSGCIRLINDDVADLYSRVNVGTRVVVLPGASSNATAAQIPAQAPLTR